MKNKRLGVGIIGLQPGRSWASRAHIPALRALADRFDIIGVANSSPESASEAAAASGISKGFADARALVTAPEVDIVTVTVRVPFHRELVTIALEAGKHVYCEWPLGNGLVEAEDMAALARSANVLGVVGTQARVSPTILHLKQLLSDGYVGDILSSTLVGRGGAWGGPIQDKKVQAYQLDAANGATMLTIPVGHTLAAVREVLGEIGAVASVLATRRPVTIVAGTEESLPVTAPDQVLVSATLIDGAPLSLHYRGGAPRDGQGFLWEINGTKGDIRIRAPLGHVQMVPLLLEVARGDDKLFSPIDIPQEMVGDLPADPVTGNVARLYERMADDIEHSTRSAPTFDDAVALHRVIDAIEDAARRPGTRVES
ncbi:gfo/Idh/MocA family oxidoreductase [Sphingobium sp. SCG-1]|uniref:Gfo/Idh/MocA family protein n=1 Tax=Sphingobium sp. SCG-1 TaxID=2072936 RepID=UPI000CD678B2|nr:Gfo/Idh/MocA family oxidoreductase [Sphingobium sp. SCG-1]AUW60125.1 gfo/Idh/MocA family oxidoreductase [Sphingobium sp. SCG-1]